MIFNRIKASFRDFHILTAVFFYLTTYLFLGLSLLEVPGLLSKFEISGVRKLLFYFLSAWGCYLILRQKRLGVWLWFAIPFGELAFAALFEKDFCFDNLWAFFTIYPIIIGVGLLSLRKNGVSAWAKIFRKPDVASNDNR